MSTQTNKKASKSRSGKGSAAPTRVEAAIETLREEIVTGKLAPGEPLRLEALSERLGIEHDARPARPCGPLRPSAWSSRRPAAGRASAPSPSRICMTPTRHGSRSS